MFFVAAARSPVDCVVNRCWANVWFLVEIHKFDIHVLLQHAGGSAQETRDRERESG